MDTKKHVLYKTHTMLFGAKHTIRINDIPLSRDMLGEALTAELPLNELIVNGECSVTIELLPLGAESSLGEEAELKLSIRRFENPNDLEDFTVVFEHTVEPGALAGEARYDFGGFFEVDVPYQDLLWTQNTPIDIEDQGVMDALEREFEGLWNLFNQQDVDAILALFDAKFADFEECYSLPEGDRRTAAHQQLTSVFADSGYELGPYNKEWFFPFLSADGRLVSLLDNDQKHYHYINFYHRARRELVVFPIYLGLNENQKVTVCL